MELYGDILESVEAVTALKADSFAVNLLPGATFGAGDEASVLFGLTTELGSETDPVSLDGSELGSGPVTVSVPGLSAGERYYYAVKVVFDGETHVGSTRHVTLISDDHERVRFICFSDRHHLEIENGGGQSAKAVGNQCVQNMLASASRVGSPLMFLDMGDSVPYAKFGIVNKFPIDADGQSVNPTAPYALSQQDVHYDCRLFRRNFALELLAYAPLIKTPGNHDGEQWWHVAANNGGANDTATYSRTGFNSYFGNAADIGGWSGDSLGRWGSFRRGPVLVCIANPYIDTRLSSSNPADAPVQPDSYDDWALNQEQWDHFFHADTGVVRNANPAETPFILFCIHNQLSGASGGTGFEFYGWGSKQDYADKVASRPSREHGPGAAWTNPRAWAGEHATLGLHGALVASMNETGCMIAVLDGHKHFKHTQWLDGVLYYTMPRPSSQTVSNPYDYGFRIQSGAFADSAWVDTDANAKPAPNAGHVEIDATASSLSIKYIRSHIPGLLHEVNGTPLPLPADEIGNNQIVDIVTLVAPNAACALVRDDANRTVEDSLTTAAAGSTQPTPLAKEPKSATTMFGPAWTRVTAGTHEHIAVRASIIDGAKVLSVRRRTAAGAAQVAQAIYHKLAGVNRRVSVKIRMTNENPTTPVAKIGVAAAAVNWGANPTSGDGLVLRATSGGAMTLAFGDTVIASADPNWNVPPTSFDAGLRIALRGRRCQVFADDGTGALTKRIDADIGATAYAAILADETYRHVGIGGSANNAASQGRITEFKDFLACRL